MLEVILKSQLVKLLYLLHPKNEHSGQSDKIERLKVILMISCMELIQYFQVWPNNYYGG